MMHRFWGLALLIIAVPACSLAASYRELVMANPSLHEASGMAHSGWRDDLLWLHNDSGDEPRLFAVGVKGESLGQIKIETAGAIDWEDMAAFDWNGQPHLLIADVGDNNAQRPHVSLYVIAEPDTRELPAEFLLAVTPAWQIDFQYSDGPRDCEAVAVVDNDSILLLSKRDKPPRLYRLPLAPRAEAFQTAEFIGTVASEMTVADETLDLYQGRANRPTAMAINRRAEQLAISTFFSVYLYSRVGKESWLDVLQTAPKILNVPMLRQQEALDFSRDGSRLWLASERLPAVLLDIPLSFDRPSPGD